MTTGEPTKRQRELLAIIARNWREQKAPIVMELAQAMGLSHEQSVTPLLKSLEQKGYLTIQGGIQGRQRLIQLTAKGKVEVGQCGLPLLGCITAGPLSKALQGAETFIEGLEDILPYRSGDFLLEVQGDSMTGDGIFSGDKVLLRPQVAVNYGEIAAVHVGEDYCATLKRVYQKPRRKFLELRASNPSYEPIYARVEEVSIVGVFRGLVRCSGLNHRDLNHRTP